MQLSQLFITSFVATAAWANPDLPMFFFAKVNGTLEPLFAVPLTLVGGEIGVLSYGVPKPFPDIIQFTIRDVYALTHETSTPGFAGIYRDYFAFSKFVRPINLHLDSERRVRRRFFYSCDVFLGAFRSILGAPAYDNCFEVEIYLLPYDRKAKSAVKPIPPGLSMGFCAEINGTLIPLSSMHLGDELRDFGILTHGNPSAHPAKFTLYNNVAYAKKYPYAEPVGMYDEQIVFGPRVPPLTLQLNSRWQVLHGPFYSCDLSELLHGTVRGIVHKLRPNLVPYCFEVKIYLLPYERFNHTPVVNVPAYISESNLPKFVDDTIVLRQKL